MLFMVVEHFRDNDMVPVYHRRLREGGRYRRARLCRKLSRGQLSCCFQLMRWDDLRLIRAGSFEIVPVVTSAEARGGVEPYLEPPPSEPAPEG
jgi:hypothetical protein